MLGISIRFTQGARRGLLAAVASSTLLLLPVSPAASQGRGPDVIADVAEQVIDSVVNISTSQNVAARNNPVPNLPNDPQLDELPQAGHGQVAERPGLHGPRRVAPEGPADRAGIQHGDRITAIDGSEVHDLAVLYRALWAQGEPGTIVRLSVRRGDEEREIEVKTIDRYRYLKLDTTY